MKTITKKIIADRERELSTAIRQEESSILLLESGDKNLDALRQQLGWDEDIQEAQIKLGESIEIKKVIEKHGNNIIDRTDLTVFCLENNYMFDFLNKYKGPISTDLLNRIKEYSKEKDLPIEHIKESLLILAPFNYFTKEKKDVKRIKSSFGEIALLEKVTNEHRENNKTIYKILHNEGKRNRVRDYVASLFHTFHKAEDTMFITVISAVILLIFMILGIFLNNAEYTRNWVVTGNILLGLSILAAFICYMTDLSDDRFYERYGDYRNINNTVHYFSQKHYKDYYLLTFKDEFKRIVQKKLWSLRILSIIALLGLGFIFNTAIVMNKFRKTGADIIHYKTADDGHNIFLIKTGVFSYEKTK